jgi:hypothetical protein
MAFAKETKIFDPADGFGSLINLAEVTDSTLAKRGNRWWMYLAGSLIGQEGIHLFSASLPGGATLSATGWQLTSLASDSAKVALLAEQEKSKAWDLNGGRHCPCYVRGWDLERGGWVERIYYAGAAENLWGPYTIGFLEWDGSTWVEQSSPVFLACEEWERGSVYEPNVIYHDGKWKMWFVSGSNQEDYLVQGYSESADGRTGWSEHKIFCSAEEKMFDFCVTKSPEGDEWDAVFSRVWVGKGTPPQKTGLWWCRAKWPSSNLADWSEPVQIMTAEDRGWRSGPWKPCVRYGEDNLRNMFVFFDGLYKTKEESAFPFVFTLGCLEIERPLRDP